MTATLDRLNLTELELTEWEHQFLRLACEQDCKITQHTTPAGKQRLIVKAFEVDAGEIEPNPWNPNEMHDRGNEATGESLQEFGRVTDIICRCHPREFGRFEIIDGEHRHKHFLGMTEINVVLGLSEAECKKLTIVMDSTRGELSTVATAQILQQIQAELGEELRLGLPWTDDELDERIKLADVDWEDFDASALTDDDESDDESDDEWRRLYAALSEDAFDVLMQARALIEESRSSPLHDDKDIAWGQVIEILSAEYLAMPGR